jgi:Asp-tRNA(Asn)/Glu-tRNA(Gln) amidotransferase A subunit family amidase
VDTAIDGTAAEIARAIRSRECSAFELVQVLLVTVGVQLVGARWRDEELLATARAVDGVVGGFRAAPDPAN